MRVLMMIPSLGAGGAERVMTLIANGLAALNHEVILLTLAGVDADFFRVEPRVERVGLGLTGESSTISRALVANWVRVRGLRRVIASKHPDVVLSFITSMNVLAIFACLGQNVRLVISERVDPRSHPLQSPWRQLRSLLYRAATVLVVQTAEAASWFNAHCRSLAVVTIANPVVPTGATSPALAPIAGPFVVASGRLVRQKGFDTLIQAFALVRRNCPELRLVIAGEGPEEATLRRMIVQLDLESHVVLLGRVENLPALIAQATVFVLSSRYEGFPNVLLEALASSVPVVATDCPGGPHEILAGGRYGLLTQSDNPAELANAITRVATDRVLQRELSTSCATAVERYRLDYILAAWEKVLSAAPDIQVADPATRHV